MFSKLFAISIMFFFFVLVLPTTAQDEDQPVVIDPAAATSREVDYSNAPNVLVVPEGQVVLAEFSARIEWYGFNGGVLYFRPDGADEPYPLEQRADHPGFWAECYNVSYQEGAINCLIVIYPPEEGGHYTVHVYDQNLATGSCQLVNKDFLCPIDRGLLAFTEDDIFATDIEDIQILGEMVQIVSASSLVLKVWD